MFVEDNGGTTGMLGVNPEDGMMMECFVGIRYLVFVEEAAGVGEVFDG